MSAPASPSEVPLAPDRDFRIAVWRTHGATRDEAMALLAHAASPLHESLPPACAYPLPDAPCVDTWERYAIDAAEIGAYAVLRRALVQLHFAIAAGTSRDPAYVAATRRGEWPRHAATDLLVQPEGVHIFLHATPAGRVPVVRLEARQDFETLVRAMLHRNEPVQVPTSVGAYMIAGYRNWNRVAERRRAYQASHPEDRTGEGWAAAFHELLPHKALYQDRFMILSSGPYSGVPAKAVGLSEAEWRDASIRLRLEHESTHYFTRQAFGTMRQSLLDELVADYIGLVEALGGFRAELFLRFLGIETHDGYREEARLANYRGDPPLSDRAFGVLRDVLRKAAAHLEQLSPLRTRESDMTRRAHVITALLRTGLEGLAADDAPTWLAGALQCTAAPSA